MLALSPEVVAATPVRPQKRALSPEISRANPSAESGSGAVFDIFDMDNEGSTRTLDCASSTQGTPSHAGTPRPRLALQGKKRGGEALGNPARKLKRPSYVNSPFVLKRSWTDE